MTQRSVTEGPTQVFYREVHVDDARLAVRRFAVTNFGLRCPACAGAKVTRGAFGVVDRCPRCGSRFDRMEGNELISIPLSFFGACVLTLLLAVALVSRYGFFDGLMPALIATALVLIPLLLRPVRVATLWMLWLLGFVYPDRAREKGRHELPVEAPR